MRVTGPFTVESLLPHRMLPADEDDPWLGGVADEEGRSDEEGTGAPAQSSPAGGGRGGYGGGRAAGPAGKARRRGEGGAGRRFRAGGAGKSRKDRRGAEHQEGRAAGAGRAAAEGRYLEAEKERRAAITIGPEYGTVPTASCARRRGRRSSLRHAGHVRLRVRAPRQRGAAKLGRLTVLRARMNPELHMGDALKKTGAGNLFMVFGEPDIEHPTDADDGGCEVEIQRRRHLRPHDRRGPLGRSTDDIACWFIDTDYDERELLRPPRLLPRRRRSLRRS